MVVSSWLFNGKGFYILPSPCKWLLQRMYSSDVLSEGDIGYFSWCLNLTYWMTSALMSLVYSTLTSWHTYKAEGSPLTFLVVCSKLQSPQTGFCTGTQSLPYSRSQVLDMVCLCWQNYLRVPFFTDLCLRDPAMEISQEPPHPLQNPPIFRRKAVPYTLYLPQTCFAVGKIGPIPKAEISPCSNIPPFRRLVVYWKWNYPQTYFYVSGTWHLLYHSTQGFALDLPSRKQNSLRVPSTTVKTVEVPSALISSSSTLCMKKHFFFKEHNVTWHGVLHRTLSQREV